MSLFDDFMMHAFASGVRAMTRAADSVVQDIETGAKNIRKQIKLASPPDIEDAEYEEIHVREKP